MTKYKHILAKKKDGEVSLTDHLIATADAAAKAAEYWGFDQVIAREGALLHDIGKASPIFQAMLSNIRPYHPFRHEIASLFFLSLLPEDHQYPIIEMIIGHHKSIYDDANHLGIIDMIDSMSPETVFRNHSQGFGEWSIIALDILEYLGIEAKKITIENANNSFEKTVEYCENIGNGWSEWRGLLVGADHYASALKESAHDSLKRVFKLPDLSYYHSLVSQDYPLSLISTNSPQKHTILKAPTGSGKTHFLLKRCKNRVFYILPYQASINAMYERIRKDIGDHTDDIRFLHSTSRIISTGNSYQEVVLQDKFGAAVKILTPHQIAAIAFGIKGYESMLMDLKGCDVILDEIHTYSSIIQAIVLKIIEILDAIDCRIHIGTATMPTVLYEKIIDVLGSHTVYEISLKDAVLHGYDRHIVKKTESFEDVFSIIEKAVKDKKKVLVVCNTVGKSQELFQKISDIWDKYPSMLIHSRFKRSDRKHLEEKLMNTYCKERNGCIVVSTQVIEVSLDISFDLMITEAAPLDSLIQRFGRINRHKRWGEKQLEEVYVLPPPIDEKKARPYLPDVLKKSYDILPDNDILRETDIQSLLDFVYPDISFLDIDLSAVFERNKWKLKKLRHKHKSALLELLDIDTVPCISETDAESYIENNRYTRMEMEIPVNYKSISYKKLAQLKQGNYPFLIPERAYSNTLGLLLNEISSNSFETAIL
jgi:CRISPR-associated endonuclease/helicase Cas3